ncbi:MAG: copper amine oxidase N-terminal domain-containing protein [Firmicutes bacterium]|nr:copper amine oxidase N-terminal domain-containing protein [Bacillota bacterium]
MDVSEADKETVPREEPTAEKNEQKDRELALQEALNAEAEKKLRETGGLTPKAARPPVERGDTGVERRLAALVAERMEQEEEPPAPSRWRAGRVIPVLVIATLLIALSAWYGVHRLYPGQTGPSPAVVENASPPPPPERTRVSFKLGQTTLMVNDTVINMDVAPQSINDRVMLPVSYVASALNCQVDWEAVEQKVSLKSAGRLIEVWIGRNTARVDGREVIIDPNNDQVTPMIVPPGRTMVPLRFLAESLGSQVDWNQEQQAVTITN